MSTVVLVAFYFSAQSSIAIAVNDKRAWMEKTGPHSSSEKEVCNLSTPNQLAIRHCLPFKIRSERKPFDQPLNNSREEELLSCLISL